MSRQGFRTYPIRDRLIGLTVSKAVKTLSPQLSWSEVRRLIQKRYIQINGNLCVDETRKLTEGESLRVWENPLAAPIQPRQIKILFSDSDVVVVDKPAGITTLRHAEERTWSARRKQIQPTLDECLEERLSSNGERPRRARGVFAVHRLDRDTSGVMVFARTRDAEKKLIADFRAHRIVRRYLAIVHGHPEKTTIETFLVRDRGDGLRGSLTRAPVESDQAQRAVTHLTPLQKIGEYSVVELRLETGRTHQIRIHLAEMGFMLCGEKTYSHRLGEKRRVDSSQAPRQALHAAELIFLHPRTGEQLRFQSPLPPDLRSFLTRLERPNQS